MTVKELNNRLRHAPALLAAAILIIMVAILTNDKAALAIRLNDQAPTIEFDLPEFEGPADLRLLLGQLRMQDDYGLDFTTYRMKLVELGKEYDLPIPGMLGKDYEQRISFSWLEDKPEIAGLGELTVEFAIADDHGQKTTLAKKIPLR